MAPLIGKQAAICMVAFMVALWVFAMPFPFGEDKAFAQEIPETAAAQKAAHDPGEVRDLAEEAEDAARALRKWTKLFDSMLLIPIYKPDILSLYVLEGLGLFPKILAWSLEILAPSTFAEAMAATKAAKRAFRHQARAYEALAKKLRQEADRLEREQKKKN